jgi:hypothetical protein
VSPYSPQHPLVPLMDYHCCFRCSCSHFCWSQIRCASNRCLVYKEMQPGPRKSSLQILYCRLPYIGPIGCTKI